MIDEVTARTPKITKRGVGSLRWQAGPWGALQRVDPSFNPYVHVGQLKLNTLCKGIKEGAKVALWEGRVHSCSLGGECRRREKFDSSAIGRQAVNSRLQFDLLQETINSRRFAQSTCSGRWCVALSYTWAEGLRPRRRVTVLRFGGPGMVRMQDKNKQEKKNLQHPEGGSFPLMSSIVTDRPNPHPPDRCEGHGVHFLSRFAEKTRHAATLRWRCVMSSLSQKEPSGGTWGSSCPCRPLKLKLKLKLAGHRAWDSTEDHKEQNTQICDI